CVAQPLRDAEPVHVGEHHVEHDEVGLLLEDRRDRLCAVDDGPHLEARESQTLGEQVSDIGLVVHDEDTRCGHAPIMTMNERDVGFSGSIDRFGSPEPPRARPSRGPRGSAANVYAKRVDPRIPGASCRFVYTLWAWR